MIEENGGIVARKILTILVDALLLTASKLEEPPLKTAVVYCQECLSAGTPDMMWAALAAADAWRNGH